MAYECDLAQVITMNLYTLSDLRNKFAYCSLRQQGGKKATPMAPSLEIGSSPQSLLSAKTANVSSPWVAGRRLPVLDGGWSPIRRRGHERDFYYLNSASTGICLFTMALSYFLVRYILFNTSHTNLSLLISLTLQMTLVCGRRRFFNQRPL